MSTQTDSHNRSITRKTVKGPNSRDKDITLIELNKPV